MAPSQWIPCDQTEAGSGTGTIHLLPMYVPLEGTSPPAPSTRYPMYCLCQYLQARLEAGSSLVLLTNAAFRHRVSVCGTGTVPRTTRLPTCRVKPDSQTLLCSTGVPSAFLTAPMEPCRVRRRSGQEVRPPAPLIVNALLEPLVAAPPTGCAFRPPLQCRGPPTRPRLSPNARPWMATLVA